MVLIDAVVANHNTSAYTELMIRSLWATHAPSLDLSLTVMDNASTDDMTGLLAAAAEHHVPILPSGFTTARKSNSHGEVLANFVAAHPQCRYLLFLDADVCFIQNDTILQMLGHLEADSTLFGVGVRQSWDGLEEIPESHRANVYHRPLHPCCALIENSPLFRRVVQEIGLTGSTHYLAAGDAYWDTCELATKVMRTHGLGYAICPAMILHFFNVSYEPRWMEDKNARRDRLLAKLRGGT